MKYSKITISGKICAGKSTLFDELTQTLKWPTFSASHIFRQAAQEQGLVLEAAEEQESALTQKIDNQIRKQLETHEHIIVEGWMAGIKAAGMPKILKVFLTATDSVRFARFSKREHISIAEAQKRVLERETSWLHKLEAIYARSDFFAPQHYDLIIDTSNRTPDSVTAMVLKQLNV